MTTVVVRQSFPGPDDAASFCGQLASHVEEEVKLKQSLLQWLDSRERDDRKTWRLKASPFAEIEISRTIPSRLILTFEVSTHFPQDDPSLQMRGSGELPLPEDRSVVVRQIDFCDLQFVELQPKKLTMGDSVGERTRPAENPVEVEITKAFAIQRTEVTQAQWYCVMKSRPWIAQDNIIYGDDYPAVFMTWPEAVEFTAKLTEILHDKHAIQPTERVRLPTEAEWELSCRGGSAGHFCFGNELEQFAEYAWIQNRSFVTGEEPGNSYPHRVAQKAPNRFGLFDVHGNVHEMCLDFYTETLPGGVDPQGPPTGKWHVLRSGGWDHPNIVGHRSSNRTPNRDDARSNAVGMRLVISQ